MYQFAPTQCAENLITIGDRECDFVPSTSGLYLSDLTGVNIELLSNLADGRYSSAVDYSKAILRRAVLKSQEYLKATMATLGYEIKQGAIAQTATCSFGAAIEPPAPTLRGLAVKRLHPTAKFTTFFIEKIQLKFNSSGTAMVQIRAASGAILWQKSIILQAGIVLEVSVLQEVEQTEFYIVIDNTTLSAFGTICTVASGGCCGQKSAKSAYAISGWDGMQTNNKGFGIVLFGGMQCSFAQVACQIFPYIAEGLLTLCEVMILQDMLTTDRINYSTIYVDASAVNGRISALQNSAKQSIILQVNAQLDRLKQDSPACISCNKMTTPYAMSRV